MPLTIYLDNQAPAYSGGETLRGRVVFDCLSKIDVKDVRVSFSGYAKTTVRKVKCAGAPRATYRGKALLSIYFSTYLPTLWLLSF